MINDRLGILKDVVKVFKSKSDAVIYIMNGMFFCINYELSLVKTFKPKDGLYNQYEVNLLNNTIHLAECITKMTEIPKVSNEVYMNNIIDISYNPYTYDFNVYKLRKMYTGIIFNITRVIEEDESIPIYVESEDFVNDPLYSSVFEMFNLGTGIGDIIKAVRNPKYSFTIYKGLIPYNKSDRVMLRFIDDDYTPRNYTGPKRFYTNFKVIKSCGILDVYTRNLCLT